jgi:flagellar hook-basal body complex protein FliE
MGGIQGVVSGLPELAVQAVQPESKSSAAGGFEAVLEHTNSLIKEADKLSAQYATGGADLTEAALTAERADVSLGFLMAIRRQAIQAYQQIMSMPV